LNAAGHDQDIGEGAAYGAAFGAGGQVAGEVVSKVASGVAGKVGRALGINRKPTVPTNEGLTKRGHDLYEESESHGLMITPAATSRLKSTVTSKLADEAYHPGLNPELKATLEDLDRVITGGNVTLKGLDTHRQLLANAKGSTNPQTRRLAMKYNEKLDDFLDNLADSDVIVTKAGGNKTDAIKALREAQKTWAQKRKDDMIEEALYKAGNNSSATHSGGNVDNAIRQQFRAILANEKKRRSLSADERKAMELIVRGVKGERLLRTLAKLSPNGSGLMAVLQMGGIGAFGPGALVAPGVGIPAKMAAEKLTPSRVNQLRDVVRAGGNAAATRAAPNAAQLLAQSQRGAIGRTLGLGGMVASPARADEEQY
jgi:predicted GIY-YIG superfamily endonuclease